MFLVEFKGKFYGVATKKLLPTLVHQLATEHDMLIGKVVEEGTFCVFNTNKTKIAELSDFTLLNHVVKSTATLVVGSDEESDSED